MALRDGMVHPPVRGVYLTLAVMIGPHVHPVKEKGSEMALGPELLSEITSKGDSDTSA
jgi:hypothetical protein